MNIDYHALYLKYKIKYIKLKNSTGAGLFEKYELKHEEDSKNIHQILKSIFVKESCNTIKELIYNILDSKIKKKLKQEIRFRRFAITRGFTNMQQFINMFNFINFFILLKPPEDCFITCELKFDVETILKRIKLFKK